MLFESKRARQRCCTRSKPKTRLSRLSNLPAVPWVSFTPRLLPILDTRAELKSRGLRAPSSLNTIASSRQTTAMLQHRSSNLLRLTKTRVPRPPPLAIFAVTKPSSKIFLQPYEINAFVPVTASKAGEASPLSNPYTVRQSHPIASSLSEPLKGVCLTLPASFVGHSAVP